MQIGRKPFPSSLVRPAALSAICVALQACAASTQPLASDDLAGYNAVDRQLPFKTFEEAGLSCLRPGSGKALAAIPNGDIAALLNNLNAILTPCPPLPRAMIREEARTLVANASLLLQKVVSYTQSASDDLLQVTFDRKHRIFDFETIVDGRVVRNEVRSIILNDLTKDEFSELVTLLRQNPQAGERILGAYRRSWSEAPIASPRGSSTLGPAALVQLQTTDPNYAFLNVDGLKKQILRPYFGMQGRPQDLDDVPQELLEKVRKQLFNTRKGKQAGPALESLLALSSTLTFVDADGMGKKLLGQLATIEDPNLLVEIVTALGQARRVEVPDKGLRTPLLGLEFVDPVTMATPKHRFTSLTLGIPPGEGPVSGVKFWVQHDALAENTRKRFKLELELKILELSARENRSTTDAAKFAKTIADSILAQSEPYLLAPHSDFSLDPKLLLLLDSLKSLNYTGA